MSAVDAFAARPRPRAGAAIAALYSLLLRTQVTIPRLLGIGALAGLAVLLGVFARWGDEPTQAAADVVASYGLGIVVPLGALWFGTSAIGDLVEDRLLVYLWLKPVPRWQLPAAAILATITLVGPLTALPLAAAALAAGDGGLALTALVSASLAVCAYSGLFVAAGIWFRRAVWWGLAFVLLWENAAAHSSDGLARFTVTSWAHSILSTATDVDVPLDTRSVTAAFVVLPVVTVAGWLLATLRYGRADVD
jgi:ABC-2 type transport system permease protein